MKRTLSHLTLFVFVLGLSGCIIEETGEPGPVGPPGNANVFSTTFIFTMDDAVINGNVASVQYELPGITRSVVDDGAVLMFYREQGTWTAMPYTFAIESQDLAAVDYTIALGFGYEDQFLEVFYEASTDAVLLENEPDREVKAVIIDGFPAGKHNIDLNNHDAVMDWLGLKK